MINSKDVRSISLRRIKVKDINVRHTDRNVEIDDLIANIKKHGLMQPVVLRGKYKDEHTDYELIIGQRRYLAHKALSKDEIPAIFSGVDDEVTNILYSLSENMQRVQLNHANKAEAINKLYKSYGNDLKRVSKELGFSEAVIREYVNIDEQVSPKTRELLRERKLNKADVRRILNFTKGDKGKADKLVDKYYKLPSSSRKRLDEVTKVNPESSVDEIIEEIQKPRLDETIVIRINKRISEALLKATKKWGMDKDELAKLALVEWLENNSYLVKE